METKILAVIPARSGSKSVKDKNIRLMAGKPLLAYSIEHARQSRLVNRIIVSTDSEQYASIAAAYGAEIPFLRPAEISGDSSLDIDVFEHALNFLRREEGYEPDIVVQLRPTYPIRQPADIDRMIEMLLADPKADSIRCIAPAGECAYKMWRLSDDGTLRPLLNDIEEAYNRPRQELPPVYYQNACIDVVRSAVITEQHSMSGHRILGYRMEHNFDIDTEEEFQAAETYIKLHEEHRTFVFDIDGVIAKFNPSLNYAESEPNEPVIRAVNKLFSLGHKIVLFTARGYKTGYDWSAVTREQLKRWNVHYSELRFGKPDADFYIDDKMLSLTTLMKYLN